ncbi:protein kinase [Thalassotalea sp. SU-HH00458]|uniref:protein kinase domain-containing protein n=1 Tax=Thalassotalea sp. SU-HH00458 TaxID=3127657 RepID=UPI0031049A21
MSKTEEPASVSHDEDLLNKTQEIEISQVLSPGDCLVGRFEIQAIQGQGNHGVVYRAMDKQLSIPVAIKVLHPALSANEKAIVDFKNELLLVRQLSHPNIIRVHEYYQQETLHFITMDWIDGESLESALAKERLSVNDKLSIISQLMAAIDFAQQAGITHGDIKPDNVLLDKNCRVFVADFGLSVLGGSQKAGVISASPYYSPPEYLQSAKINATTDLYAIGVISYQLCCLSLPFSGKNLDELITSKQTRSLTFSTEESKLSHLAIWVLSLISPDPLARPRNVAEASKQFSQLQEEVKPDNNKKIAGVIAILSVLIFIVTFASFQYLPSDDRQPKDHYGIAVLPTGTNDENLLRDYSRYISYQLVELPYLRVINQERLTQLLNQLGITLPLSNAKIELIADLLKVDVFVQFDIVVSGNQQQEINFNLLSAKGFNITNEHLVTIPFDEQVWRKSTQAFLEAIQLKFKPQDSGEHNLHFDENTLKALLPVKQYIHDGQFELAQESLTSLLNDTPQSAEIWLQQGELYLQQNLTLEAEEAYAKAANLSTTFSYVTTLASARLNDLAGKLDEAQTDYLSLVNAFPYDIALKMMLAEFYLYTEQHAEMEALLLDVVKLDPHHPTAWFMLGKGAFLQGNFDKALDEYFVKALVTAKKLKNLYQEGEALNAFGVVYGQQGEIDLAFDYYQQALTARTAAGNLAGAATTMTNLAAMHLSIGEYNEANTYLTKSLNIYQQLNDQEGLSNNYNELGVLAEEQALYQEALDYYRQALEIRENLNNQLLQAESMNNIGFMFFMLQDAQHALVYWRQAEQLYQKIQFPLGIVHVRQSLGQLELAKGNWRNAYHLFNNALKDAEQLNSIEESLVSRSYLSLLSFIQGNFQSSIDELLVVYKQAQNIQDVRAMAEFGLWLADWSIQIGDSEKAEHYLDTINEVIEEYGNKEYKSKFKYLRQQSVRMQLPIATANDFQSDSEDIAHQTLLIRQAMNEARFVLKQGKRNIAPYLAAISDIDFSLNQYLYIEYLELLAVQQYFNADWSALKVTLRNAELLLRKMGGYWRSFQFDRLRAQLAIATQQSPDKYHALVIKKLSDLSANLPTEKQKNFLNQLNYFDLQDVLQEYIRHD